MRPRSIQALGATFICATTFGIAAAQEPNPPYVTVPPDWKVGYGNTPSWAVIKGPKGEELYFSAYLATGWVAMIQREMDANSTGFRVILDERLMEVAVTTNGLLAISFPPTMGKQSASGAFDYWAQPRNPRQAVKAFLIALTYFDVRHEKEPATEEIKALGPPTAAFPFDGLGAGWPLPYDSREQRFTKSKDMTQAKPLVVQLTTEQFPLKLQWFEKTPLLGGTLSVAEADDHTIWSRYATRGGETATFVAREGGQAAAVLAIAASLTYSKR